MKKIFIILLLAVFLTNCATNEEVMLKPPPARESTYNAFCDYRIEKQENIDFVFSDTWQLKEKKQKRNGKDTAVLKRLHKVEKDPLLGKYKYAYKIRQNSNKANVLRLYCNVEINTANVSVRLESDYSFGVGNAYICFDGKEYTAFCKM